MARRDINLGPIGYLEEVGEYLRGGPSPRKLKDGGGAGKKLHVRSA